MNRRIRIPFFLIVFAAILLSACGVLIPGSQDQVNWDAVSTSAAQTVAAQLTQIAAGATPTPTSLPPSATPAEPTPTLPPATPLPTATPAPTFTPTAIPIPCDWALFVKDVTVEDGDVFSPGAKFSKTWRLKNIGRCSWTQGYDLVFWSGHAMSGPAVVPLQDVVDPGETIDVTVQLTAPAKPGDYRGDWKLRNAAGVLFGLGSDANQPFWVKIKVSMPVDVIYDFTEKFCAAEWRSGAGLLACPGSIHDQTGFVVMLSNPKLEYAQEDETGLFMHPQVTDNGFISGTFPLFRVEAGDRFKAVTACLDGALSCNVMFQLNYREASGPLQNLASWTETYDGEKTVIDVDLSELDGKSVQFVLTVLANGSPQEDWAFWLRPRIVR